MVSVETARKLALSLPETEEKDHFGAPSFRVRGKIYAQLSGAEKPQNRAVLKLSLADQTALVMSDPDTFSPVPQWGRHGWTYVNLAIDRDLFESLLRQAWGMVAPKKLKDERGRV